MNLQHPGLHFLLQACPTPDGRSAVLRPQDQHRGLPSVQCGPDLEWDFKWIMLQAVVQYSVPRSPRAISSVFFPRERCAACSSQSPAIGVSELLTTKHKTFPVSELQEQLTARPHRPLMPWMCVDGGQNVSLFSQVRGPVLRRIRLLIHFVLVPFLTTSVLDGLSPTLLALVEN